MLLDNLYCNGHVSADGHPWSTMAYNTDYIARNWALTYSSRAGIDDDDHGDLSNAPSGYLWDACARAGLSYRSYGEYGRRVSQPDGSLRVEGAVPGLVGHMCPDYGISSVRGRRNRDTDNAETFIREFQEFEKNGNLPRFMVMSLGEDHTTGTRPGTFTPQACVASNDLALGRIVETVTHSKYWPETAIFVIEDDAQNGPDHVDAHRTVGLVISPYTKRNHLDSTQYSTVSMLRTIELILGLSPLSQFDAAARPMFASFTDKPNLAPYTLEPARIDLNAVNTLHGLWRRAVAEDGLRRVRSDRRLRAQRDSLACDQGQGCRRAAGRPPGDRVPAELQNGLSLERVIEPGNGHRRLERRSAHVLRQQGDQDLKIDGLDQMMVEARLSGASLVVLCSVTGHRDQEHRAADRLPGEAAWRPHIRPVPVSRHRAEWPRAGRTGPPQGPRGRHGPS